MNAYLEANRALWDEWTGVHARSEFYDVAGFRAGRIRLHPLERAEVGDVEGKSLLHLQCHFGLDTLSWARLGASVTGVDFSEKAIRLAHSLSHELDIPARFVCCNVLDLTSHLEGAFDIVFTSYGALCWLPDVAQWARTAASFVKPGGALYVADFHPTAWIFDDSPGVAELVVRHPYFHSVVPTEWEVRGSYADPSADVAAKVEYGWAHPLSDVVNAVIDSGLRLAYLHEHAFSVYRQFQFLAKCDDGYWRAPPPYDSIPLMFSLRAVKP